MIDIKLDSEQVAFPVTIMRGGTSRALYFRENDLPPPGPLRDTIILRAMGKPGTQELDGLGGGQLVTSKVAIVGPATVPGADINYTFGQIEINSDSVDWSGNCGNISSGVGPFAIDIGLVRPTEPVTEVKIYNTNTDKILIAHIPIENGKVKITGDYHIAGVPGTGAEIIMDFKNTLGAKTGKLLPTGNVSDTIQLENGKKIEVSIVDLANTVVFVKASSLGLSGTELPSTINSNQNLMAIIEEIKNKAAERIGFIKDWRTAKDNFLPFVSIVAPPQDYTTTDGIAIPAKEMDFLARIILLGTCVPAYAGTGACCTAACACIPGSTLAQCLRPEGLKNNQVRLAHPLGIMPLNAKPNHLDAPTKITFDLLGFGRTARKIMDGLVYIPKKDLYKIG